jgi:cob(I)alamin adenosyltransferase
MSIVTKTGDDGTTALMFARRVPKTDPRVEAYGCVDELNSALGLARACREDPLVGDLVLGVQKQLVVLMGELAVMDEDRPRYEKAGHCFVSEAMIAPLDAAVLDLEKNHKITFDGWATPGATLGSAALDVARTVCRRAERQVSGLAAAGVVRNPVILRYLNRLSDLCWLCARFLETKALEKTEDSSLQSRNP